MTESAQVVIFLWFEQRIHPQIVTKNYETLLMKVIYC